MNCQVLTPSHNLVDVVTEQQYTQSIFGILCISRYYIELDYDQKLYDVTIKSKLGDPNIMYVKTCSMYKLGVVEPVKIEQAYAYKLYLKKKRLLHV